MSVDSALAVLKDIYSRPAEGPPVRLHLGLKDDYLCVGCIADAMDAGLLLPTLGKTANSGKTSFELRHCERHE